MQIETKEQGEETNDRDSKVQADVGVWSRWNKKFVKDFKKYFKSTTRKEKTK